MSENQVKTPKSEKPQGAEGQAPTLPMSWEEEEKWWEEKEVPIKKLLTPEGRELVILNLVIRTSESYYNYKSTVYAVFRQPDEIIRYEDSYVLNIRVEDLYCGAYQQLACYDIEEALRKLEAEGYKVKKVFEA